MTKLSRKLLISVFTLAFALVTLGATTFAWFTLTSVAKIDPYTVNIETGEGIEISLDGLSFKSFITHTELLAKIGPKTFDPVTTSDGKSFFYLTELVTPGEKDPALAKDYIEFDLFVRTPVEDRSLTLLGSTTISSTKRTWVSDIPFNYDGYGLLTDVPSGTSIDVYAANAFRMSFEENYNLTFPEDDGDPIAVGEYNNTPKVFELDREALPNQTDNNIKLGTEVKTSGLLSYWNAKKPAAEKLETTHAVLPSVVYFTEDLGVKPLANLTVTNGKNEDDKMFYSCVKVRMWLEGWDPDSFDSILASNVEVELQFGVIETPTEP